VSDTFLDLSLIIDITLTPRFPIGVGACIHRIGEDMVDRGVSRWGPTNVVGLVKPKGKVQAFGVKPEPHSSCRTQLGKTLEHRANGGDHRGIGVETHLAVLIAPDEANRQPATQFAAGGLVTDAPVEPCSENMGFGFTHSALEPQHEAIVEQSRMVDPVGIADQGIGHPVNGRGHR
jgi:hypothetical protein